MDGLLSYVDAYPIWTIVIAIAFVMLIMSNIVLLNIVISNKRTLPSKSKITPNSKISEHDIDVIKTVIYQIYENFLEKEYSIEKEYNMSINSVGKSTIYNIVQNIVILYGKSLNESVDVDESEVFKNQDLLELYITRDLNKIILSKLEGLYDCTESHRMDDFELNNKIETVSHEIIDSLTLGIKNYELMTQPLTYLEKTLDSSSRPLFDEIRKSVKAYTELSKNKQKEKMNLVKTRNEIIDKQILLLIGGIN